MIRGPPPECASFYVIAVCCLQPATERMIRLGLLEDGSIQSQAKIP
jgi:hypothetical protein